MKTTFLYFPGMFENPAPAKIIFFLKIKKSEKVSNWIYVLQHHFYKKSLINANFSAVFLF